MSLKPLLQFLVLLVLVAMPILGHLDEAPVGEWDEARVANSAIEMAHSHNWIVTTFNGIPDKWTPKPPLMPWLQIIVMKIIGVGEIAVRLPSALAALITCVLLFWIFAWKYKAPVLGFSAAIVLVCTQGYVCPHGSRTGDYDVLMTLFMAGYALSFYFYVIEQKPRLLFYTFLFLTLAVFTKSVQGLLFAPALFVYAVYKKKLVATLRQRAFLFGLSGFVFFVGGYYLLREKYDPGFLNTVWQNQVAGLYSKPFDGYAGSSSAYTDWVINNTFHEWYLLVIPGIVLGVCSTRNWLREITVYITILALTYLIIISCSETKAIWYAMPLYPLLAVLTGIFFYSIVSILQHNINWQQAVSINVIPYVFLFLAFAAPYNAAMSRSFSPANYDNNTPEEREYLQFLSRVLHHQSNIDGCDILDAGMKQNMFWYYQALGFDHRPVHRIDGSGINPNGKIVAYLPSSKKNIEDNYNTRLLEEFNSVKVYQLNGRKLK